VERGSSLSNNIADAIMKLYRDPALRREMSENGKKRAEQFSADAFYRNMVSAVEEICNKEQGK
jgi:glycosyltransferase involved in cell wall biosynthesis